MDNERSIVQRLAVLERQMGELRDFVGLPRTVEEIRAAMIATWKDTTQEEWDEFQRACREVRESMNGPASESP